MALHPSPGILNVTVNSIPSGVDLFGKDSTDLQEDIAISDDKITGTLKYVTDYTGFSGNPAEQQGNYLAIHIEADDADATIKAGINNLTTLDEDGNIVIIVSGTDKPVTITAEAEGKETVTKTLSLEDIVLTPES